MNREKEMVIVSLTSYPARIKTIAKVLEPIFEQTRPADKVLLWLADSQFPNKEKELPTNLLSLQSKGLEICWCDDIKTHKKYYYSMLKYPDAVIITIDDDAVYAKNLIEQLMASYARHPNAVSSMRVHEIAFDETGSPLPYTAWKKECDEALDAPSFKYMATGVGGVLYPPKSLHSEVFNKENLTDTCLFGDDLWLKTMEIMAGTPVVLAQKHSKLELIEDTQKSALWHENVDQNRNDQQFEAILKKYNTWFGEEDLLTLRMDPSARFNEHKVSVVIPVYNAEKYLRATLDSILRQTCTNLEIICVNDESTDRSASILEEYAQQDSRFKIITIKNQGPGPARDIGVTAATGEYLAFCDSDDILPEKSLEVRLRAAIEKQVDIVVGPYREVFADGRSQPSAPLGDMKDPFWAFYASSVVLWNKLYKTEFLHNSGVHFTKLKQGEDRIYITELYVQKPTVATVSDCIYDWMRRPAESRSLSYADDSRSYFERMESWIETYKIFKEHGVPQANQLLFGWSEYLKSQFDSVRSYDDKAAAFEKIKEVMSFADWNIAQSKFRRLWGVAPEEFFAMSYSEYGKAKLVQEALPKYWYADYGEEPIMVKYQGVMPIVLVADDGYALPMGVLMTAIKHHRKENSAYEINILSINISPEHKDQLQSLSEDGFSVVIIEMSGNTMLDDISVCTSIANLPATPSAMYKFLLPEVFPQYDKILYLDCDLLVLDDLSPLFDLDLSSWYAAVVMDSLQVLSPPHLKRIRSSNKTYFNSGVMMLNLKKMRRDNVVNSLIDYRANGINYYMDQDAFNTVFNDNVLYMPFYYNMDYTTLRKLTRNELCRYYHVPRYDRLPVLYRRAKILHFTGFSKPWKYEVTHLSELYMAYFKESLFANEELVIKKNPTPINTDWHFYGKDNDELLKTIAFLDGELRGIRHSASYRIGRFITFIPRKLRGGIRCYREHGWRYTWNRILVHLHIRKF